MDTSKYSKEFLSGMYRTMYLIRQCDLRAVILRQQGFIPGFIHPSEGEEATAVGACAALRQEDVIVSNHRGHAHHIAKGGSPKALIAELMARETGDCHGRGGSLHVANFDLGNIGANGIVGGGIPIAVGAGLAFTMSSEKKVALAFFGDGASNQGTFHESLNLASTWTLPVIFFCENNHYGEGTAQDRHMNIKDISIRATGYGIPGIHVDGNDVIAVYEATQTAVSRALAGKGPTLIEAEMDRFCGAYEGDPQDYRTKEEITELRKSCPISRLRTSLLESEVLAEEELDEIDLSVKSEIEEAVEYAKESPYPKTEDSQRWVYVNTHDDKVFS